MWALFLAVSPTAHIDDSPALTPSPKPTLGSPSMPLMALQAAKQPPSPPHCTLGQLHNVVHSFLASLVIHVQPGV